MILNFKRGNSLGDYGVEILSESFAKLKNLQNFYMLLDWNKITKDGAKCLAESLRNMPQLVSLNLDME